jgi:methylenetetrahydrofolate dehydrogenase (NADP+) / methenyltetrahydrofolate cyclohydrolase
MSSYLFDGKAFASVREQELKVRVQELKDRGVSLRVKTITFVEDKGSRLYTKLKAAAATRLDISYEPVEFSLSEDMGFLVQTIREASVDAKLLGIMIQKPSKAVWTSVTRRPGDQFAGWWDELTNAIDPRKDIDGLTAHSKVLPATVKACLTILEEARKVLEVSESDWKQKKVLVIGRSDIVGKPLTYHLRKAGHAVENAGRTELSLYPLPLPFDLIISATGVANLINGEKIKDGSILIDVGAPSGDIELSSVQDKASFVTPVPGGVGPVTVVSLMENILEVAKKL